MIDDPTFAYRVVFGLLIFSVLGAIDLARHPDDPRRLKEYGFLFGVTGAVMLYGVAHDAVTFAIAPEYFSVLKGLGDASFFPDVARLALMASWTVGLAIGLVLLVANNPSRRPQLGYRLLVRQLGWPFALSPLLAVAFGTLTACAPSTARRALAVDGFAIVRPDEVAVVWAIHIGTYAGAALGAAIAVVRVRALRGARDGCVNRAGG
ncbi:MAG: hypothetical protein KC619_14440 [Myxococcales bacterium]|nr:hypothetical protein [Myxococcales bacterium]